MENLINLIIVVLLMLAGLVAVITWLYWPELRSARLTAKRHKDYEDRLSVGKSRSASITGTIKSENDYSEMFKGF